MSDTQALLGKIAALRHRLEHTQGLMKEADAAVSHAGQRQGEADRLRTLERQIELAEHHSALLDSALRQFAEPEETQRFPVRLTGHARSLLERGRDLLTRLRQLADDFDLLTTFGRGMGAEETSTWAEEADPLAGWVRRTVAMADTALRVLSALPDSASGQLRICPGVQAILEVVARNLEGLGIALDARRREGERVHRLAELLRELDAGKSFNTRGVHELAEEVLVDAHEAAPLRLLYAPVEQLARFVACHSLVVAQVIARCVHHHPEFSHVRLEPIISALLHDVGMLRVPVEILSRPGPLNDIERRVIEAHPTIGAGAIATALPRDSWLIEATATHHERIDGTGYPAGLRHPQLSPLSRLLSVCDFYAALCAPRPFRPARETRTALTDTLLLAEQGMLDRSAAERLLQLSFYPVGMVVELADGAVGVVVSTPSTRIDLNTPSRPVVAVLTDSQAKPLPSPQHVDLGQCDGRSIVRALPATERRDILGTYYPELAA